MIKVDRHLVTCTCAHCSAMFPHDRFDATWIYPAPPSGGEKVLAKIPIGHAGARPVAFVWVDADQRLASDFPGFPGTVGARVEVDRGAPGGAILAATRDPALMALADPVPLTRRAIARMNQRMMVEYGLAEADAADYVACERHGPASGIAALACAHVLAPAPVDAVVLYDADGAYPDLVCTACLPVYRAGDASVVATVCSRCQQWNLYHHRLVGSGVYGT